MQPEWAKIYSSHYQPHSWIQWVLPKGLKRPARETAKKINCNHAVIAEAEAGGWGSIQADGGRRFSKGNDEQIRKTEGGEGLFRQRWWHDCHFHLATLPTPMKSVSLTSALTAPALIQTFSIFYRKNVSKRIPWRYQDNLRSREGRKERAVPWLQDRQLRCLYRPQPLTAHPASPIKIVPT